ncbi:MAG: hypothetical protein ACLFVQ_02835 [Chitinispirillaceae bacterium]
MEKFVRKPVGNFFIKKSLQLRLITKVVLASLVSTIVSSGSLLLVYYLRYHTVVVYQWDQISDELNREHIFHLILPTLIISSVVGILVSIGIGLYTSRKYAVPIYKIEQWTSMLLKGKMTALLRFREKEEMKELSERCNELGGKFRSDLLEIKKRVESLEADGPGSEDLKAISSILAQMELEEKPSQEKKATSKA